MRETKPKDNDVLQEDELRTRRDIRGDFLTPLERRILNHLNERNEPVSVRELAEVLLGPGVAPEAKGSPSLRTIRNALRVPKAMGLLKHSSKRGSYIVSDIFKSRGFAGAIEAAGVVRLERERRRSLEVCRESKD